MTDQPVKKSKVAMVGAGLLAVFGALTTGFFNSVGEMAGEKYIQSAPGNAENGSDKGPATSSKLGNTGSKAFGLSRESDNPNESTQAVVIDTVELSFGSQASENSREKACSAAIAAATKRAEYQCQSIAREQKASSFELVDNNPSCTQCSQLSSNWRCVTNVKPTCKIME